MNFSSRRERVSEDRQLYETNLGLANPSYVERVELVLRPCAKREEPGDRVAELSFATRLGSHIKA